MGQTKPFIQHEVAANSRADADGSRTVPGTPHPKALVVSPPSFCKNVSYCFFFLIRTFCFELAKPVLDAHAELLTICSICQLLFVLQDIIWALFGVWVPGEDVGSQESDGKSPRAKPAPSRYRKGWNRPPRCTGSRGDPKPAAPAAPRASQTLVPAPFSFN